MKKALNKIKDLTEQISKYPKSYIFTKDIGNSVYYYHQWSVNEKNIANTFLLKIF